MTKSRGASAVLGIDAAWTEAQPSGVALIQRRRNGWRILRVAPSYRSFLALCHGTSIDWERGRFRGTLPDVGALLEAATRVAQTAVSVVAVDMPLSLRPIVSRRAGDLEISRRFGSRGCSTHSPMPDRPGPLSLKMTRDLARHGIGVATTVPHPPKHPCAVEVYPHVALLALLDRSYRVPYKVSRSTQYWPGLPVRTRIGKIRTELRAIASGLEDVLGSLPFSLPPSNRIPTLAHLKRYEDALDALVSAWVGSRLIDGKAEPFGDEESAIWVPRG